MSRYVNVLKNFVCGVVVMTLCFTVGANAQGTDMRADIELRREWVARLTEIEETLHQLLNSENLPYSVFYTANFETENVNYQTETADISVSIILTADTERLATIQQALQRAQTVFNGLNATGRKDAWQLGNWPWESVTNNNPFRRVWQHQITMVFELFDQQGQSIGRQVVRANPSFKLVNFTTPTRTGVTPSTNFTVPAIVNIMGKVVFSGIKVDDISDQLTIRPVRANGSQVENAPFTIRAVSAREWTSLIPRSDGIDALLATSRGEVWTVVAPEPEPDRRLQQVQAAAASLNTNNNQQSGNTDGMQITGRRSQQSIRRVIQQNMGALRHAYNRRLRERPSLSGVITITFSIDEFGQVTNATMDNSTINDAEIERIVLERVRSFVFERIDVRGDVTTVTYPFSFTR